MKCNKDCFNCPYPDCGVFPREPKQPTKPISSDKAKTAAYMRAYYEANREKICARQRENYRKSRAQQGGTP